MSQASPRYAVPPFQQAGGIPRDSEPVSSGDRPSPRSTGAFGGGAASIFRDPGLRARAEARLLARELDFYELVRNVAGQGAMDFESGYTTWEGCLIVFECPNGEVPAEGVEPHGESAEEAPVRLETKITMPDGTVLYHATKGEKELMAFRTGKWVGRFKKYSEYLTHERYLKPFSEIDF